MTRLPARIDLQEALQTLRVSLDAPGPAQLVRVFLADGTAVIGELNAVSEDHLALIVPGGARRELAVDAIEAIQRAAPNRSREGVLMLAGIVFGTTGVVAIAVYGGALGAPATSAFPLVFVAGAVAMHGLMRTPLRYWLVSWVPWFRRG